MSVGRFKLVGSCCEALFGVALLFFTGCKGFQIVDSTVRPIILTGSQERTTGEGVRVVFPPGSYVADFKTRNGIYYRAPDKLAVNRNGRMGGHTGGLYLPSPGDPDQRQGAWFEEQEPAAGEIKVTMTPPTKTYRFPEPILFRVQNP